MLRRTICLFALAGLVAACGSRRIAAVDGARGALDASTPWPDTTAVPKADPCATNAECGAGRYCHVEQGCVANGAKLGECRDRPTSCPLLANCPETCGCDGKTYCGSCLAHKAGVNVTQREDCLNCAQVNAAYMAAVVQAKACSPMDPSIQCTLKVWHALPTGCPCPCETYVDPANTEAIKKLKAMEALWLTKSCGPGLPPPPDNACCALYPQCTKVTSGSCTPGPTGAASCQDK